MTRSLARWVDERFGTASITRKILNKVFPDHWSFMLGEIVLYCFIILVATGVYLTMFFEPSAELTVYGGSYVPLQGIEMSRAYASALDISFAVRSGLVVRQVHHWAALLFVAVMVVHLLRIFFTGAFRKPRELNWVIGVSLLVLAFVNGFTGYSIVDDQLSGTGLRIGYSIILSIPLVGTWLASLLLGGEFPGPDLLPRLTFLHVMIVPAIIAVLIGTHMVILMRQKHTQFGGRGRRDNNVVGLRLWPTYASKAIALFFVTTAVLTALGGLVQINPLWLFGPFRVADVSSASQPDWYMGWLEGALRLMPAWEPRAFGFELPNPFFPSALLMGMTFGIMAAWPWIEARFTGDRDPHHLLDRPRDRPVRTSIGVAALVFFSVLFIAGSDDVLAVWMNMSVITLVRTLQVVVLAAPIVVGLVTYWALRRYRRRNPPLGIDDAPTAKTGHAWWEKPVAVALVAAVAFASLSALSKPSPPEYPETWSPADSDNLSDVELYRAACASCHGANLEGEDGPELGPDSGVAGLTDERIARIINDGVGEMPSMSGVLSPGQIDEIIAFMRAPAATGSTASADL